MTIRDSCWAFLLCVGVAAGCAPTSSCVSHDSASAREAIAAQIARSVQATRDKNIEAFLSVQAPDFQLQNDVAGDEHGERVTQAQLRESILRDWSVIAENRTIDIRIDSLSSVGDSATVYTSQRYDRLMHQREGPALDTVETSVKHREVWRRLPAGWRVARVQEIWHGPILINGSPYMP